MGNGDLNIVTGAFSFTGKHITRRLLAMGESVKTLTGHPKHPSPFGDRVDVAPFDFDDPVKLTESMQGAKTIYNTYWIRFPYGSVTYDTAVGDTKALIKAASDAGLRKFVHVSITNASVESTLRYFEGKAILEKAVVGSGLSYAIVKPTVIFGDEGILINNIAWMLRKFPAFPIPGDGEYRLQPIFVEDLADLVVGAGHKDENVVTDAAGPEIYTFNGLVRLVADKIGKRARLIHLNPGLALWLSKFVGYMVNDVVLTKDEAGGLMDNLLVSNGQPTGQTRLSEWLEEHKDSFGCKYLSELVKHYRK